MNPQPNDPPPDDDLPPHLASPEAFHRWCRENPEGLRQMEMTARRIELGEFGDVTPELRELIARFLTVRKRLCEAAAQNAEVLAEITTMRETLAKHPASVPSTHLVEQLEVIEGRLKRGETIGEEWSQFRLQYEAFQGELMGSIERRCALIVMNLEAQVRRDPEKFAHNEQAQELLRQWREGGQREKILGKLPIAERRELEALERRWREENP